jgi:hypothetical protein
MTIAVKARDYPELLQVLDARRRDLGLTMEAFDERSGLTNGYSAKLFCGMRNFGPMSLPVVLQTLGVELLVAMPPAEKHARPGSCGHVHDHRPISENTS